MSLIYPALLLSFQKSYFRTMGDLGDLEQPQRMRVSERGVDDVAGWYSVFTDGSAISLYGIK